MNPTVRLRVAALAVALGLMIVPEAGEAASKRKPPQFPVHAFLLADGSPGEVCEEQCLKSMLGKVRRRRGVKRASVEGDEIRLEVVPGVFKAENVIQDLVGLKVEMRLPYKSIEIRFVPSAPFPPAGYLDGEVLVVEIGEAVREAIDSALKFKLPVRMKCVGKTSGPQANEATLVRFEQEKRPPVSMVPFMAEADLDGDRRQDLYLRIAGLPELIVFNKKSGFEAVPIGHAGGVEELPRCEQNPLRYARGVARKNIKCMGEGVPKHAGDAIELVEHNRSNRLLMWSKSGFAGCEPLGEGALPPLPPKEGEEGSEEMEE
ncbi:MAG TPA: hypothetical protein DFS52_20100 [Myxococcales bacterium]|jgi:hypothetical protein|nr:hypothetical protein [Myxococcales bacterium]